MTTKSKTGRDRWIDPDDAPALTKAMLDEADVFDGNAFVPRGRGRPKSAAPKEQISVRIDPDILAALRAAGPGWQSQINALLREALTAQGVIGAARPDRSGHEATAPASHPAAG